MREDIWGGGLLRKVTGPSYDPHLAWQVALWAYQRKDSLDAILITGDLGDTGDRKDLELACSFITASPSTEAPWLDDFGQPTLSGTERPIILLPGNHDRFHGPTRIAGGSEFEAVFDDVYWKSGARVQIANSILSKPDESNCPDLALVRADFTLRKDEDALCANYSGPRKLDSALN